jgi:flagellar hook-length control protein FliK
VPVTLNPPPFPTPDKANVSAADKSGAAQDEPGDAFATLLTAAGDSEQAARIAAGGGRAGADSNVTARSDSPFAARTIARLGHKNPITTLPIVGSDNASVKGLSGVVAVGGIASAEGADADKADDGNTSAVDATSAGLAGVSAMLSALLTPASTPSGAPAAESTADASLNGVASAGSDPAQSKAAVLRDTSTFAAVPDIPLDAAGTEATRALAANGAGDGGKAQRDIAAGVAGIADALLGGRESATTAPTPRDMAANLRRAREQIDSDAMRPTNVAGATVSAPSTSVAASLAASLLRDTPVDAQASPNKLDPADVATLSPAYGLQHAASPPRPESIAIATPVTSPGWQGEFAEKLGQVVMAGSDRAEFRLHPADMGPVDVRITVNADQASVLITAPHAATRDALEQALPQLRDLLANQGITLGQANVQSENRPSDDSSRTREFAPAGDVPAVVDTVSRSVRVSGLVDVFA